MPAAPPRPKLSIPRPLTFAYHRGGWAYALDALQPLLKPGGVILDPFFEATFCWDLEANQQSGELPYRREWIGIIHNPPGIPEWHDFTSAPQVIFNLPAWRDSLPWCRGLYVFSQTMRVWTQPRVNVPVEALLHPTQPTSELFTMGKFLSNPTRRVIQVGSWLRRLHSIAMLSVTALRKTLLSPRPASDPRLQFLLKREATHDPAAKSADWSSVEFLAYQAPEEFDKLLSANLVFLDLYDTVVNNTVLECIVRQTPVICNRLPALVELLGDNYPLFFSDLREAASKAEDMALIEQGYRHLSKIPASRFSQSAFRDSVARGAIYQGL